MRPGLTRLESDAFEDDGDALADADAHGAKGVAAVGTEELIERGCDEAGAAGSERMAYGDGAAVGIHMRSVIGDAEIAQDGESLRSESLVELDDVHLRKLEASFSEDFARGGRGAHAHDPGSDASSGCGDDAGFGCEAV